jgi:hypothetical protein
MEILFTGAGLNEVKPAPVEFLVYQTEERRLRFLLGGKHRFQVGLRGFELGLLGFLRGLIFGEQVFDLRRRSVIVNRLLQGITLRVRRAEAAATARSTLTAAAIATAHHPAHAAAHADIHPRRHDLGDQRFNGRPFRVIGEIQPITDAVHHALLELRGIKVAAATLTVATLAATALVAVVAVILCEKAADAQSQSGRDCAQRENAIQFHLFSFVVVNLIVCSRQTTHACHLLGAMKVTQTSCQRKNSFLLEFASTGARRFCTGQKSAAHILRSLRLKMKLLRKQQILPHKSKHEKTVLPQERTD